MAAMKSASFVIHALVFLFTIGGISCQERSCGVSKRPDVADKMTGFWLLEDRVLGLDGGQQSVALSCAVACLSDPRCVTFMVNSVTGLCRLHAALVTPHNVLEHAPGSSTYNLMCRGDAHIGQTCAVDADCRVNNTGCVELICQCQAGYSYAPTLHSCVEVCSTYGTEFVGFKDNFIARNNAIESTNSTDICPGCCFQLCVTVTSILCKTVEITPTDCVLATVTALDVPSDYLYYTGYNIVHHQRQCSNDSD